MAGIEYPSRYKLALNQGWRFMRGKASPAWLSGQEKDGEIISLPHCWNGRDTFQPGVAYYRGNGAYRLSFAMPHEAPMTEPGQWILKVDGFYGTAEFHINEQPLGRIDGQYLGFEADVSSHLRQLQGNHITALLDSRHRRDILPGIKDPDFLLFGGLSGCVHLVKRPRVYLSAENIRIDTWPRDDTDWHLRATFTVASAGATARCSVRWVLQSPSGNTIKEVLCRGIEVVEAGCSSVQTAAMDVPAIECWDVDHPVLYRLCAQLIQHGNVTDEVVFHIGFRSAEFLHEEGLFLNGRRLELRGCNRHESMPGFGRALPPVLHREDAHRMKDMGLNFVRLSHYPQHPAFLDACDELGLLVYAEIATWKSVRGGGKWLRAARRQAEAMVRRDRHRPCVLLWGMGNESRSRRAYTVLQKTIQDLDPNRPVTYAENHLYRARRKRTVGQVDVWSLNYELDALQEGMEACRLRNVIVSECSNSPETVRGELALEARQVETIMKDLRRAMREPFVAGFALWCLNDYATLRKKRYLRYSGILDAWRQTKMAADVLRARYTTDPFIRLYADWEIKVDDGERDVYICTNCSQVSLLMDGRRIRQMTGEPFLRVRIPFAPTALCAEGVSGGNSVTDACNPWRSAHEIRLQSGTCAEDGWLDLLVDVTDGDGHPVRSWSGTLHATLDGDGELFCYTPDNGILVTRGTGRFFVRLRGTEPVDVAVVGAGLMPGHVTVPTKKPTKN